jgi:hypothetical protein
VSIKAAASATAIRQWRRLACRTKLAPIGFSISQLAVRVFMAFFVFAPLRQKDRGQKDEGQKKWRKNLFDHNLFDLLPSLTSGIGGARGIGTKEHGVAHPQARRSSVETLKRSRVEGPCSFVAEARQSPFKPAFLHSITALNLPRQAPRRQAAIHSRGFLSWLRPAPLRFLWLIRVGPQKITK